MDAPPRKLFVAGDRGLVGSAILNQAAKINDITVLTSPRAELDLCCGSTVSAWFQCQKPTLVIHAAGKVGGIVANSREPVDFLHDNALMGLNVLRASWESGVEKLLMLGSSCIYPRECPQPIREEYLCSGALESTNEAYAVAKIACLKACDAYRSQYGCSFISAMPTNLFGPNDNFHPESSHVIPGMLRRFHEAKSTGLKSVTIWGSGEPRREFLFVDDLAEASLFLLENYDEPGPINVGTGQDVSIRELAELIREIVYPQCGLIFDRSKPDGTPRKLLDVNRIHKLGWHHKTSLGEGLEQTYRWFLENQNNLRE